MNEFGLFNMEYKCVKCLSPELKCFVFIAKQVVFHIAHFSAIERMSFRASRHVDRETVAEWLTPVCDRMNLTIKLK